jgi:hypothetical protein
MMSPAHYYPTYCIKMKGIDMRYLSIVAIALASLAGCAQALPPNRISAPSDANIVPGPQYAYGDVPPDLQMNSQSDSQPSYQQDSQQDPQQDPQQVYDPDAQPLPDDPAAEVDIDPPLEQQPPVRVEWAPPPLLDEAIPPPPYPDAIWIGGYWVWQDDWVWARGRWLAPPQRDYRWVGPYYEHRGDSIIFINGFWAAPGVSFRRPPPNLNIPYARVRPGARRGPRPNGPEGSFMPPHGARRGSFVPASTPQPQTARPAGRDPAARPPQLQRQPRPQSPLQAMPRPQSPQSRPVPQARQPMQRPQPQAQRPQHRAPPPRANRPAARPARAAPAQHEAREHGGER